MTCEINYEMSRLIYISFHFKGHFLFSSSQVLTDHDTVVLWNKVIDSYCNDFARITQCNFHTDFLAIPYFIIDFFIQPIYLFINRYRVVLKRCHKLQKKLVFFFMESDLYRWQNARKLFKNWWFYDRPDIFHCLNWRLTIFWPGFTRLSGTC